MGVYHFFSWFRKNFYSAIYNIKTTQTLKDVDISVDNLMIDMNGIFHNSAQKIYEYGNYKRNIRFLNYRKPIKTQVDVFKDVCESIEELFMLVKPKKKLIMAVDGPAPSCKMYQQRQRRYKSVISREEDDNSFDGNSLSPGTKFMDNLTRYIDWYIKKRMSEDKEWQKIEVVFSNANSPGEGESKIFNYIRKFGDKNESYVLHGSDADLIMLALTAHIDKFYILREDVTFDKAEDNKFFLIDIGKTSLQLTAILDWGESENHNCDPNNSIIDFVFLCFMMGNDFVPHIPGLEIIEGGIDTILNVYRDIGKFNGHITKISHDNKIYFNKIPLKIFFQTISEYEKPVLEHKLKNKKTYFEDKLLESCAVFKNNSYELDIDKYRKEYCKEYFGSTKNSVIEKVCHSYLEGLQFVISYYTQGVPNWNWNYKYHYAPSTYNLSKHIDTFTFKIQEKGNPLLPFQQLMYILPPKSFNLLPPPLNVAYQDETLSEIYPEKIDIDLSGKKNDYQGIALLPFVDVNLIKKFHNEKIDLVNIRESSRNKHGKTFVYSYMDHYIGETKKFYYGDISNYKIRAYLIDI